MTPAGVPEPVTADGRPLAGRYELALAHEHVFIDIRCWLDQSHAPTRHLRDRRVDADTVEEVRGNPFACLDNLVLDDAGEMRAELALLPEPERTLVVDVTPANVGRDPERLAGLGAELGLDLVYGCGRYIAESRPQDDPSEPPEAYRDEILAEFDGGGRRPSVIGEIGTGDPILPVERASLLGAAMAQAELGVPLYVHLHPWARRGHEVLDIVEAGGGDPTRTVLCHLDPQIPEGLDYHAELCDRGATIAFDIWGDDFDYGAVAMPSDQERLAATLRLIERGHGDRLVHSQDVCTKTQLRRWGGPGFDHLPRTVAPRMRAAGLDADEVHRQMAGNVTALLGAGVRGG
jgi:phosphotriesterase-related protein